MTDTEWILVGEAKKGDAYAFAKLYEKYYNDLYRFALSFTGDAVKAQDAVSEAVLTAYEKLRQLKKDSSFKSWIFSITANECRRQMRSGREVAIPEGYDSPTNEEGYISLELESMLSSLDDTERLVVTLSVFSGYRSTELARMLDMRPGSIRSVKSRALAKLREVYK